MTDTRPRLALFIDRQNVYRGAREIFGFENSFHTKGQVNPLRLGNLIAGRVVDNQDRRITAIRIYRGIPDSRKSRKGNAAYLRHKEASERLAPDLVTVIGRPLRYPHGWPQIREHEKGIDVQLSIDFVLGYVRREFDVGVLFSGDTDVLPSLEAAHEIAEQDDALLPPEVAAWGARGRSSGKRLRPKGLELHCHWLGELDLKQCEDDTDYNVKS